MNVLRTVSNLLQIIYDFFYEMILGCSHTHLTRPFTLQKETYMVCLDCGKQIYYSPVTMRQLSPLEVRRMHATHTGEVRIMPSTTGKPVLHPVTRSKTTAA
jgi:hypothetical protein